MNIYSKQPCGSSLLRSLLMVFVLVGSLATAAAGDGSPELRQLLGDISVALESRVQDLENEATMTCPLLALAHGTDAVDKKLALDKYQVVVVEPLNDGIEFAATALGLPPFALAAYHVARCAYDHEQPGPFGTCLLEAVLNYAEGKAGGFAGGGNSLISALASLTLDQQRKLAEELAQRYFDEKQRMVEDYQGKPEVWDANYSGNGCESYILAKWDRRKQVGARGGKISLTVQTQCNCDKSLDWKLGYRLGLSGRPRLRSGIVRVLDVPVRYVSATGKPSSPGWSVGPFGNVELVGTCCDQDLVSRCALAPGGRLIVNADGGKPAGDVEPTAEQASKIDPPTPAVEEGICTPCDGIKTALVAEERNLAQAESALSDRRQQYGWLSSDRAGLSARITEIEAELSSHKKVVAHSVDNTTGVLSVLEALSDGTLRSTKTYPDGRRTVTERINPETAHLVVELTATRQRLRELNRQMEQTAREINTLERFIDHLKAKVGRLKESLQDCVSSNCGAAMSLDAVPPVSLVPLTVDSHAFDAHQTPVQIDLMRATEVVDSETHTSHAVPGRPVSTAVEDMDGNGTLDVLVANSASEALTILLGDGTGTFLGRHRIVLGQTSDSVAAGDLNFDGLPDIAAASGPRGDVTVVFNRGNGEYDVGPTYHLNALPGTVSIVDANRDELPDILLSGVSRGGPMLIEGTPEGTFATPRVAPEIEDLVKRSNELRLVDLTGNGVPQVLTVLPDIGRVVVFH